MSRGVHVVPIAVAIRVPPLQVTAAELKRQPINAKSLFKRQYCLASVLHRPLLFAHFGSSHRAAPPPEQHLTSSTSIRADPRWPLIRRQSLPNNTRYPVAVITPSVSAMATKAPSPPDEEHKADAPLTTKERWRWGALLRSLELLRLIVP